MSSSEMIEPQPQILTPQDLAFQILAPQNLAESALSCCRGKCISSSEVEAASWGWLGM